MDEQQQYFCLQMGFELTDALTMILRCGYHTKQIIFLPADGIEPSTTIMRCGYPNQQIFCLLMVAAAHI